MGSKSKKSSEDKGSVKQGKPRLRQSVTPDLKSAFESWKAKAGAQIQAASPSKTEALLSRALDFPADGSQDFLEHVGFPGEYPFTRGVQASMYLGRTWTMRQYSGFGTAQETNKRYHYLLAQGTTGLSVAFDLPTQMGRDPDQPQAFGEVGRVGVSIACLDDMRELFAGIPLENVSTSMTINATAHILLGFYLVLAQENNISWDKLRGTVQNDILKEYIARGTYIYPPNPGMKISCDISEFCKDQVPLWNTISISGYHIREAGSTAAQELGFTLANGIAYVEALLARGLKIDSFAPRLAFFFNCHNNFLEEVAKFRAARRCWARIMKERFSAQQERSCMLRFHTQTAGSSLTAQQPHVNVVRTTLQALAAVLGGTQSLHTNSFDEALGLPTEEAATLALRTQQVIASESGVKEFIDPLAGSYAIERMTDELEAAAMGLIDEIDRQGGMVRAIENGFPSRAIEESSFRYQQEIESGEREIVGVNVARQDGGEKPVSVLRIDPHFEEQQREKIAEYRRRRDQALCSSALQSLERAAKEGRNLMPDVVAAITQGATLGEISDILRVVYGEHHSG